MGFFGSLLGNDQKDQVKLGNKTSKLYMDRAIKQAEPELDRGYGLAREGLQPFAESGREANSFYDDLLGLNGPEARSRAQQIISSDPQFTGELASGQNAMLRFMNARGQSGGGAAALAGQRILTEQYGNWMDRYRKQAETGGQYATQMADLDYGHGKNKADLKYGYNMTRAGQATGFRNAMVQAQNSGVNNVLNLAGTAARAATGFM